MKKIALIVAGGTGTRMETPALKQFVLLNNLPVLMHTINVFYGYDNTIDIRIALPEDQIETWQSLCDDYQFKIKHSIVPGGETRFHSVKNGLAEIPVPSLIAVHDGVRPLVSKATITNCFNLAEEAGTAIPVVKVKESIRKIVESDSVYEDRNLYRIVQTPQVFHSDILLNAYETDYNESFTDDAGVVENAGFKIYITEGNEENIKITRPIDLVLADAIMRNLQK
jgi:2-C-methyl-D-erythritol 4-phosphate cytidylyltransferase